MMDALKDQRLKCDCDDVPNDIIMKLHSEHDEF